MALPAVAQPQDLWESRQVFGVIKTVNLATASGLLLAFKASPRPVILTHVTFDNFSVFPLGSVLPAGITTTWGTDAAGSNMFNAAWGANAVAPFCLAQRTDLNTQIPYAQVNQSVLFAVTVGVAASGTCDVTFIGAFV